MVSTQKIQTIFSSASFTVLSNEI